MDMKRLSMCLFCEVIIFTTVRQETTNIGWDWVGTERVGRQQHSEVWITAQSLSIYLSIYLSVCLSPSIHPYIYGSIAFVDLGRFFSLLIRTQSVGLLGRGISASYGSYLHREQRKHRKKRRHPCLKWDWNTRSQCSSGRRLFMSYTEQPLWSVNSASTEI
jgi:hypothetical protein